MTDRAKVIPADSQLPTSRLILEAIRIDHAELCFEQLKDPSLYTFVPQDPIESLDLLQQRFEKLIKGPSKTMNERWFNWFSRKKDTSEYVGTIQATVRSDQSNALIAYQTFCGHRQQGFGVEACRAMISYLFDTLHVGQIVAEIDTLNVPSRRLVESLGFQAGETREKADFFKGRFSDEVVYRRWSNAMSRDD